MDLLTELADTEVRPDVAKGDDPVARYHRLLGTELRRMRERLNWTRRDLKQRLRDDLSLQTIATYELGTRQCSVTRFVEICLALDETPHDVLARVHKQVFADQADAEGSAGVRVDLRAVAEDDDPVLAPLRRWAAARWGQTAGGAATAMLDRTALTSLAQLCAIPADDMATRLARLTCRKE